jgi:integrase
MGDNKYQVRIFLGRIAGVKKHHTKTIFGTKKEAKAYATKIERSRDTGVYVERSNESVADFLDSWLATKVDIRSKTLEDYEAKIRLHLKPALGTYRLSALTREHIQKLVTDKGLEGQGPRSVKYIIDVLNMACRFGVSTRQLARNPCDGVKKRSLPESPARSMTLDESQAFLAAAQKDRFGELWALLILTGMRPNEALALQWRDVDFDNNEISITQTVRRTKGKGWSFEPTKNRSSRRKVPIAPPLDDILMKLRAAQAELRAEAGSAYDETRDLVFSSRLGGPLDYRTISQRHFHKLLATANIQVLRPYDLRHTSATLSLVEGAAQLKVVAERLGHSDTKMLLKTYQHIMPGQQIEEARGLAALLYPRATRNDEMRK